MLDKYKIMKTNGKAVDPEARYFVLRYDTDFVARLAMRFYADSIEAEDPILSNEIRQALESALVQFRARGKHSQGERP